MDCANSRVEEWHHSAGITEALESGPVTGCALALSHGIKPWVEGGCWAKSVIPKSPREHLFPVRNGWCTSKSSPVEHGLL